MTSPLEELFRRHATDVLAYALRRTDPQTAEDVVSDVFLVAARKLDRIPGNDQHLWLYAVARRILANQRRGERRRSALTHALGRAARDHEAQPHAGTPILDALAALRPADREVLMLTAWEGLDAAATGRVLGCSAHAVHSRLHRARRRLETELARQSDAPLSPTTPKVTS